MKSVKETTQTKVFNNEFPMEPHTTTFTKTGLNPSLKYRVCAEFTHNYNCQDTRFHANLHVNGLEIESNLAIPSGVGLVLPNQIVGYVNPTASGEIELKAMFAKNPESFATPVIRIYRISFTIEEVNYV